MKMRFIALLLLLFYVGLQIGCEEQIEPETSPIEKVLPEPVPENAAFSEPCQQDSEYECGVILVIYDEETWTKHTSPIPTVKEFLEEKGYKPEVTVVFNFIRTEVINIGNFDVLQIIEELKTVPGVKDAEPSYFVTIDDSDPEVN